MKTSIINIANSFKNVYLENIAENDITTKIYTYMYGDDMPTIEYHIKLTADNVYKTFEGIASFTKIAKVSCDYDKDENHLTIDSIDYYSWQYDDIEEVWFNIYFE